MSSDPQSGEMGDAQSRPSRGEVRGRLQAGQSLLGTFMQLADPAAHELVGGLGLDFMCIEAEHSGMGTERVQQLIAASETTETPAIVRVAQNAPQAIAAALDAGARGVIVPRVDSGAEAAAAVASARYPPIGRRGLGPSRATGYGAEIPSYLARANDELLVAIQVETAEAVAHLDEMLALESLDMVFVGPGDLACSLGIADPGDRRLQETIGSIIARSRDAGRLTGIFAANAVDAARWRQAGVELVILGSDLMWLARGLGSVLGELRSDAS